MAKIDFQVMFICYVPNRTSRRMKCPKSGFYGPRQQAKAYDGKTEGKVYLLVPMRGWQITYFYFLLLFGK